MTAERSDRPCTATRLPVALVQKTQNACLQREDLEKSSEPVSKKSQIRWVLSLLRAPAVEAAGVETAEAVVLSGGSLVAAAAAAAAATAAAVEVGRRPSFVPVPLLAVVPVPSAAVERVTSAGVGVAQPPLPGCPISSIVSHPVV